MVSERLAVDNVVRELLDEPRLECAEQFGILAVFAVIAFQGASDEGAVNGGLGKRGLLGRPRTIREQETAQEKVVEV